MYPTDNNNVFCGIYAIENNINKRVYVGKSKHITQRLNSHLSALKNNRHSNHHLQEDWNKYGEDNFGHYILWEGPESQLSEKEQFYIEVYNSVIEGYNKEDAQCNRKYKAMTFYLSTEAEQAVEQMMKEFDCNISYLVSKCIEFTYKDYKSKLEEVT